MSYSKEASTARMEGSKQEIVKTVLAHLGEPVVRFEHVYEFDQIKDAFGHFDMEVIPTGDIYEFICTPKGHVCTTIDAPKRPAESEDPSVAPIFERAREILVSKGWTLESKYDHMSKPSSKSALYVFFVKGMEPGATAERMYAIKIFQSGELYDKEEKLFRSETTKALRKRLEEIKSLAPMSVDIIVPKMFSAEKELFSVMDAPSGKTMLELQLYFLGSLKKDFQPKKLAQTTKIMVNAFRNNKDKLTWTQMAELYIKNYETRIVDVMDDQDTELVKTFKKRLQTFSSQMGQLCGQFDGANWHLANKSDVKVIVYKEPDPTSVLIDPKQKRLSVTNFDGFVMENPLYMERGELFIRSMIVFPDNRAVRPLFTIPHASVVTNNIALLVYLLYIGSLEQFRSYKESLKQFTAKLNDPEFTTFVQTTAEPRLENMFLVAMESNKKVLERT